MPIPVKWAKARATALIGVALFLMDGAAHADTDGLVLDLLQPGSRSAIGLGGDPFLSPVSDGTGWWGDFVSLPGTAVSFDAAFGKPITDDLTGNWGALSHEEYATHWADETTLDALRVRFAGRIVRPRSTGAWDGSSGELRLEDRTARAEGGVRISALDRRVAFQATVPLWRQDDDLPAPAGRVGLRYRPVSGVVFQVETGRSAKLQVFSFDLEGEPGSASLNTWSDDFKLMSRIDLPSGLHVAAGLTDAGYDSIEPVRTIPQYQLMPIGSADLYQAECGWSGKRGAGFLLRWTKYEADLGGEAYWSYERFGTLTYADIDLESYLLAFESRGDRYRWLFDTERVRASGKARAKVEFWPFTETLIDLLGIRRTCKAAGEVEWYRVHAGFESPPGGMLRYRTGATWYDIYTDFFVESWRPTFLVFGKSDYQSDALNLDRLQLAAISLGADLVLGAFTARIDLQQFVYAHTYKSDKNTGGDEGGEEEGPAETGASKDEESWTDGGRIRLSLARRF
ncbi:MAG: hypothetical protein JW958_14655 [Candidatus Eisenbacteria bacterium]|nr:hypothetical protein [Candidatus Eisenbacteria bacterium]